ncbi:IclR family transcriptional regulator C-terminal domain-containing protein [Streptomyces sp. WAC07061]|uniref:IclR family transcriptional regulator domain-containing protein n=1 Tax=Streptomyces sp. WAC07061 TaxID=2487410 RepID=UPI002695E192|nr:IclR family transcriptional regulator C-terminal domain-containing protein [Streptomyces sp. WAC07061]
MRPGEDPGGGGRGGDPDGDRAAAPRSLAEFLARASVRDRYPHYDLGAAEARLLRAPRGPGAPATAPARSRRRPFGWSDPARDRPLESERARRDLKAACLAVVGDPRAGADLEAFLDSRHSDLPGAVVFGCLLYLSGLREGSRFWWQFAAGSGSPRTAPAAYCLFLDHSRRGEHHDARLWARELGRRGFRPNGRRELREVRLCAQAAVLRYVDQCDDPDLGPVPLPRPGLAAVLAAFLPPGPPPAPRPRPGPGPLRHPALTSAARGTVVQSDTGEALAQARRALAAVRVLERHPLGVRAAQLARESGLGGAELRPLLVMLREEEYAYCPARGVYAPGPALDRLAAPGGTGLAGQLQRTLALARDSAGAAVYLSRYAEGEVRITQMADGPGAPPVREWVDFRAAAHASAVGKCLLTQLDHDGRADHVARHRPTRLTARTITDSRVLFSALDAVAPGAPVFDLREYSPGVVCSAVPIATGEAAGSLALSLPAAAAHRLGPATEALRRKAVPVLLALLLSGAIPPDAGPAGAAPAAPPAAATPETLRQLGRLFRTPLTRFTASAGGPHLVSDSSSGAAYLFDAPPEGGGPRLALPQTLGPLAPGSLPAPEGLVVLGTRPGQGDA